MSVAHRSLQFFAELFQGDDSGTSTPTAAPAATEDLDFSDIKKKKKSKKAAFDLEAFEKELKKSKDKLEK